MRKSMEEIYQDIVANATKFATGDPLPTRDFDDEAEELMTSADINKQKRAPQNIPGRAPDETMATEIEEVVHFRRYTTRREHKYTEKEMEEIRSSCDGTIVHDYGLNDIYHQSDGERRENDMLADVRLKLGTLKRTYRRPDQYIEAMRVVVQAWHILEQNNFVHTREEFFKLVAKGKIVSPSIIMPQFKGIEDYNMDLIIKYISNPEVDASTLRPKNDTPEHDRWLNRYSHDFDEDPEYQLIRAEIQEQWNEEGKEYVEFGIDENATAEERANKYDDDMLDDAALDEMEIRKMHRLLDEDELKFIEEHHDNPPKTEVRTVKRKYIRGYDLRAVDAKRKMKNLNKVDRGVAETIHDLLNKIQTRTARDGTIDYDRSWIISNGLFNTQKPKPSIFDRYRFQGSWASKTDVFLNDLALREALLEERSDAADGYATYGDIEKNRFFEQCEQAGMNVMELRRRMNCMTEDIQRKNTKQSRKANRKIEAALVRRLSKMNHDPKFKKLIAKAEKEANEQYYGN